MTVTIRPYRREDAEAISGIYQRSVEGIGPQDYTPEQVKAWASLRPHPARVHERASDGRAMLVAAGPDNAIFGFIDLESDGHIDLLYCAPETAGKGVAASLYDAVEAMARARGMKRLYSEASEAARRFFLKRGFVELARRQLDIDGVAIHNFAVEKRLDH